MNDLGRIIGDRIRAYRRKKGFTLEELADKSDLHVSFVGAIERNSKSPTLDSLQKVTSALGITLEELFAHSQPDSKSPESKILSELVFQIHDLQLIDQKKILELITLMVDWKTN